MDMILKNTFQSISPAYELIGDVTVASNTTQVDFTGLNVGKDDELLLVSEVVSVGSTLLNLCINSNVSPSNYYRQTLNAGGSTIVGERANNAYYTASPSGGKALSICKIKLTNSGYFQFQSNSDYSHGGNSIYVEYYYGGSLFVASEITSITIFNAIGATGTGSRFQLYKLVAEKVADIIVPSNTTSVDITGLNIGKDEEYYLVSDVVNPIGTASSVRLFANSNNTLTNYYVQLLVANSTSVTASRANVTAIMGVDGGQKSLAMANIKLTNSGYFVAQANTIRAYGVSSMYIQKLYNTSTWSSSALTSFTILADVTNSIGANSRFTLYKMK